jgi:2-polyprenyl-6-methoxyphenol hydroxylase-like FAD-dependent oxidoreductase
MDRSNSFDVAVVGGSIAGSTAAILFARQGLKVALIEAHENPDAYKALCTHFIQPSATPTIQRLGLDGDIERAGGLRNSLEVWNRWGWIRHPDAGEEAPFGYSIRRQKLDTLVGSSVGK